MMAALSGLVGLFGGGAFRYVTIGAIGLAALVGFHTTVENWKGNLRKEGERVCDARWEAQIRAEARQAAEIEATTARRLLETERETTEALNERLSSLQAEIARVRGRSGNGDERCLSDGVLESLGRQQAEPAGRATPAKPRRKSP